MADVPKLLPCPFCGNANVAQGSSGGFISVWCFCGARGPEVPFPETCIDPHRPIAECHEAWNRRALLSERERRTAQGVKVPEGWVLVPIEPTQAMLDEACSTAPHVIITYTEPHERDGSVPLIPIATWRAMLAASPTAPSLSTSAGGGE